MKKLTLFLLLILAALVSFSQTYTPRRLYGNYQFVVCDTTTCDTIFLYPSAGYIKTDTVVFGDGTKQFTSANGFVKATGDTITGNYEIIDGELRLERAAYSQSCPIVYTKIDSGKITMQGCNGSDFQNYIEIDGDTIFGSSDVGYFSIIGTGETNPANCVSFVGSQTIHKRETASTYDTRLLYNMMSSQTITNTTTPTSLFNDANAIGTRTIPANFLRAGTTIRIHMRGDMSNTGNPTNTMAVKLGSTTISTTTATLGTALTNSICEVEMDIAIRSIGSSGTCVAAGYAYVVSGITRSLLATTPVTINTTTDLLVDVIYTWGAANASNTLIMLTGTIQILN